MKVKNKPALFKKLILRSLPFTPSTIMHRVLSTARTLARSSRPTPAPIRLISSTSTRFAGHHAPPALLGEGAKPGSVPTDQDQSTGLERLQVLGHMEGIDVFDMQPLEVVKLGTKADPILIKSLVRVTMSSRLILFIDVGHNHIGRCTTSRMHRISRRLA